MEVQEKGGKSDTKPIPGVFLVSGYDLWAQKRGGMGQAALEKAQIVSNYTFLKVIFYLLPEIISAIWAVRTICALHATI